MEQFIKQLEHHMYQQLKDVTINCSNSLLLAQRSFEVVDRIIKELRNFVIGYNFKQPQEEINFFKAIKPAFQKELIYFEELYNLEANIPLGTQEAKRDYYVRHMERIKTFFESNRQLYNYHLSESTCCDELYYLRRDHYIALQPVSATDIDPGFSTPYSSRLAKLLAFEEVRAYLNNALGYNDDAHAAEPHTADNQKSKLVWTDQAVDIMEVILAVWTRGSVNYGKCTLTQLVTAMEDTFNIKIKNRYQILKNMRMRKKDRLVYLKKAILSSEEKMDQTDMDF